VALGVKMGAEVGKAVLTEMLMRYYGLKVRSRRWWNLRTFESPHMLIHEKLPQGHIYPQITHAPINNYADFSNFFRGGHTIDDNLGATAIANTLQASMLKIAIASGHLRSRNR